MNTDRENILWNNFKEGRPNSFRPLFDYFYVPLCEYAVQILKDKMDAEDVVLDTFFFIWKNSDRIDIGKSIRSYLFTSVKNRSLNHLRSVRSETLEDIHDIPVLDPASNQSKTDILVHSYFAWQFAMQSRFMGLH
jgi:RNA polymerase sigma-70 factor (ECF subfamily)